MHLKMLTSMGGPDLSIANGDEIPFDENFPFTANEVHRFRSGEIAALIGTEDEIATWLEANPYVETVETPATDPVPVVDDKVAADAGNGAAADAVKAAADAANGAAEPGKSTETKPAAAKAAAKKG